MQDDILKEVIQKLGSKSALARALDISAAAVSQWRRIPLGQVSKLTALTGITRERLRPDIYPEPHP